MPDYYVLGTEQDPDSCAVYSRPDFDGDHHPAEGLPAGDLFPVDLELRMADQVSGIQVPDFIHNAVRYLLVTEKAKALLEAQAGAEIEFLPFVLINHKGRPVAERCYVANVLGTVDCVDRDRTEAEDDLVLNGRFDLIERLYLDEGRIDPERRIFRIPQLPRLIIVRQDLKDAIEAAGLSGARFWEMGEEVEFE